MNNPIRVTLHSAIHVVDNDEIADPADNIISQIAKVQKSISILKDENLNYERTRDQYVIHLQQCQEDHNILRGIYKTLKQKFDLRVAAQDTPIQAANQPEQTTQVPVAAAKSRSLPVLEPASVTPTITPLQDNLSAEMIHLQFSLTTGTSTRAVQFSNNGENVAFSDSNFIYIVESGDGSLVESIEIESGNDANGVRPLALKYSPDDQFIAITGAHNDLLLYNVQSRSLAHKFDGHSKPVSAVAFSADGKWIVTGGLDGVIIVWSMSTYEQVKRISQQQMADSTIIALFSTEDLYAIGFRNGSIGIYNEQFEDPMMSFNAHQAQLTNITAAPDGTIASVAQDKIVKVWALRGIASLKYCLNGHSDIVVACSFSPNSPLLFTGSTDNEIRIWQYKKGEPLFQIAAHQSTVYQIVHHPKENMFASCSGNGIVCLWKYEDIPK